MARASKGQPMSPSSWGDPTLSRLPGILAPQSLPSSALPLGPLLQPGPWLSSPQGWLSTTLESGSFPGLAFPCMVLRLMSLSFKIPSARARDAEASHFRPDLVFIPASLTLLSLESLKVMATLHFATWNSSTREDMGSCNCPDLMYSPTDVKPGGIPSHLLRCELILCSTPSTAVSGTSYTVISHISLGSRPC